MFTVCLTQIQKKKTPEMAVAEGVCCSVLCVCKLSEAVGKTESSELKLTHTKCTHKDFSSN